VMMTILPVTPSFATSSISAPVPVWPRTRYLFSAVTSSLCFSSLSCGTPPQREPHIVVGGLVAERFARLMEEVLPVHERDGPGLARFSYHGGRKK
jgi:hypothetical protein